MPLRCMAYMIKETMRKELEWWQEQQIIVLLGLHETAKWCNSLVNSTKAEWHSPSLPWPHTAQPGIYKANT